MLKKSLWSPRESRRQVGVPEGLGGGAVLQTCPGAKLRVE